MRNRALSQLDLDGGSGRQGLSLMPTARTLEGVWRILAGLSLLLLLYAGWLHAQATGRLFRRIPNKTVQISRDHVSAAGYSIKVQPFVGTPEVVGHEYFEAARAMLANRPKDEDTRTAHTSAQNCSSSSTPELLLLVLSKTWDQAGRDVIRKTWGSAAFLESAPVPVRMFFMVGRSRPPDKGTGWEQFLERESAQHNNDLLIGEFQDTYLNLSQKVRFGLEWAVDHCPSAKWIVKMDDDMFVNVPLLAAFLQEHGQRNAIHGNVRGSKFTPVYRRNQLPMGARKEWAMTREQYPVSHYPPYADGPSYVVSRDAAGALLRSWGVVAPFPLEDAYITGVLGELADVSKWNVQGFNVPKPTFRAAGAKEQGLKGDESGAGALAKGPEWLTAKCDRKCKEQGWRELSGKHAGTAAASEPEPAASKPPRSRRAASRPRRQ